MVDKKTKRKKRLKRLNNVLKDTMYGGIGNECSGDNILHEVCSKRNDKYKCWDRENNCYNIDGDQKSKNIIPKLMAVFA